MGLPTKPRNPLGTVAGKSFTDTDDPYGIKLGIIYRVDEINMKADIRVLTGGGSRVEVDLTQALAGPRSFWGGVPEINSMVILGYRRRHKNLREVCILGYIPVGNRAGLKFDPVSPVDPNEVLPEEQAAVASVMGQTYRRKRLKLLPGNVGGMSSDGSELVMAKDIRMVNRAGDLFELRDNERTLVSQAIHRVEASSGVHHFSGPVRREALWYPPDIFQSDGRTLKGEADRYFGRDEMQNAGPGISAGGDSKFANTAGKVLDIINDATNSPPVTYANGRRVYYPATNVGVNLEDSEVGYGAEAFTENRLEMYHTTDLSQEVMGEIDGFLMDRRIVYIEQVMGTVIGNNAFDGAGQRRYGKILKPKIFEEFWQGGRGQFQLNEVVRTPNEDVESKTMAGSYLFRMQPPSGSTESCYAVCVDKQGKLYANVPGSTVENYASGASNISAEINLEGALKMFIGDQKPDNVSAHIYCEGAVVWEVGHAKGAPGGTGFTIRSHSGLSVECSGAPDDDEIAYMESIQGDKTTLCTGNSTEQTQGSKQVTVNGALQTLADRIQFNASQGFAGQYGDLSQLVSGKSVYNYALAYMETVVAGGKIQTILAGAKVTTVAAGAMTYNVAAGATLFNNAAGAFTISVGTGAIAAQTGAGAVSLATASGAISLAAGAGAISVTAGLALSLVAGVAVSILAPQVLIGGPAAIYGVCRGLPMMPPGSPSLDWVTGMPLQGCAVVRSL